MPDTPPADGAEALRRLTDVELETVAQDFASIPKSLLIPAEVASSVWAVRFLIAEVRDSRAMLNRLTAALAEAREERDKARRQRDRLRETKVAARLHDGEKLNAAHREIAALRAQRDELLRTTAKMGNAALDAALDALDNLIGKKRAARSPDPAQPEEG